MYFKKLILLSIFLYSVVPAEARLIIVFNEKYNQEQKNILTKLLKVALTIEKVDSLPLYIDEQNKIKDILPEDLVLYVIGTSYIHKGKVLRDYFFDKELYAAITQKTPHVVITSCVESDCTVPEREANIFFLS